MTEMPLPRDPSKKIRCQYDAWNRLVHVDLADGDWFRYVYDGLGRRVSKLDRTSFRHYYYRADGALLAEYLLKDRQYTLDRAYFWGVGGPGDLVARIRFGSTTETLYALRDALSNTAAVVDEDGNVKERYLFDPSGKVVFVNDDFSPRDTQQSALDWNHLFGGLYRDAETGLDFDGRGYYHPLLGRSLPRGVIGNVDESLLTGYGIPGTNSGDTIPGLSQMS